MSRFVKIGLATGAGALVSAIGAVFVGYLAAVAIPEGYFLWFRENVSLGVGLALIGILEQSIGFGLLLFAAGYLVTKKLTLSPLLAASCVLLGFWLYAVVGSALVYKIPISSSMPALNQWVAMMLVIHVLFLSLGVGLGQKYSSATLATRA